MQLVRSEKTMRGSFMKRFIKLKKNIKQDKYLLLMVLFPVLYFIIFMYIPMGGLIIAFQRFMPGRGIFESPFVGFHWFEEFFTSIYFYRVVKNTFVLSFAEIIFGFPLPIVFALMVNEVNNKQFKKSIQTISYFPHFVSTVIIVGIINDLFSSDLGIINQMLVFFGQDKIAFLTNPSWFRPIYVGSSIWQMTGWGSIIYLAALSGIDPQLYEAAQIDGASRLKQIKYITLPSLMPTIMTLLILRVGRVMTIGFEKVLLLYHPSTYETADVISTFVYRRGILGSEYSYGAAVGLFNAVINFSLVIIANKMSKKLTDNGIW
jgi:putative aldouronate transport system permease protein